MRLIRIIRFQSRRADALFRPIGLETDYLWGLRGREGTASEKRHSQKLRATDFMKNKFIFWDLSRAVAGETMSTAQPTSAAAV